jgi:hypothetical protein
MESNKRRRVPDEALDCAHAGNVAAPSNTPVSFFASSREFRAFALNQLIKPLCQALPPQRQLSLTTGAELPLAGLVSLGNIV